MSRASLVAAVAAALLVAGCIPQPATRQAQEISWLYLIFASAGVVVFAIVWALLTWALARYRVRRRDADEPLPPQDHGNTILELIWTALPALTIAVLFVLTLVTLGRLEVSEPEGAELAAGTEPEVAFLVEAFQWGWRMSYPELGITIVGFGDPGPEAVLPVDRPIRVTLEAVDVIHSFYVPEFLVKYDAVPGREREFPLLIEREGIYGGQCAEFCGLLHAWMPFTIRAVSEEEFAVWVEATRAQAEAEA